MTNFGYEIIELTTQNIIVYLPEVDVTLEHGNNGIDIDMFLGRVTNTRGDEADKARFKIYSTSQVWPEAYYEQFGQLYALKLLALDLNSLAREAINNYLDEFHSMAQGSTRNMESQGVSAERVAIQREFEDAMYKLYWEDSKQMSNRAAMEAAKALVNKCRVKYEALEAEPELADWEKELLSA